MLNKKLKLEIIVIPYKMNKTNKSKGVWEKERLKESSDCCR